MDGKLLGAATQAPDFLAGCMTDRLRQVYDGQKRSSICLKNGHSESLDLKPLTNK